MSRRRYHIQLDDESPGGMNFPGAASPQFGHDGLVFFPQKSSIFNRGIRMETGQSVGKETGTVISLTETPSLLLELFP